MRWVVDSSRIVVSRPICVLPIASSIAESSPARAAPSATVANPEQNSSVVGIAYRPPGSRESAVVGYERRAGTNTSLASKLWLPVPRSPPTFHTSSRFTSPFGSSSVRISDGSACPG